jgi:hypothetical protein
VLKIGKRILIAVVFVGCVSLVMMGQKDIGIAGSGMMLAGLAGLLCLLYGYNKKYV